jgi:hypothetical protein
MQAGPFFTVQPVKGGPAFIDYFLLGIVAPAVRGKERSAI